MGKIEGNKEKKFEKSRNMAQFIYYLLAIFVFGVYIWFVLILPNVSFAPSNPTNGTLPFPLPLP